MPFSTIVGINHHGQSILLGCALVTHENVRSFRWLFTNWLEPMGNIHPTTILINQCESIKLAISEVMPNTIHRFFLWHILCKLPQKFANITVFNKIILDFKTLVSDSLTIDIFEYNWNEFLRKYGLERNRWLKDLYDTKERWAPLYLHNYFWASLVST